MYVIWQAWANSVDQDETPEVVANDVIISANLKQDWILFKEANLFCNLAQSKCHSRIEYTIFTLFRVNRRKKMTELSRADKWINTLYRKYQKRPFYDYLNK